MICTRSSTDPLMQKLVERGINLIVPPSGAIQAGDLILWEDGNVVRKAAWEHVIGHQPTIRRKKDDKYIASSFNTSAELEVDAGASLIERVFSLPGSSATISGAAKRSGAHSVNLSLVAPAYQELLNLDEMLNELSTAKSKPKEAYSNRRFFVVFKSWRARGLAVDFLGADGLQVELEGNMSDEVAAKLELRKDRRDSGDYSFLAEQPKVFGVTLREIEFSNSGVIDKAQRDHMTFRGNADENGRFSLISDEIFFEFGQ